MRRLEKVYMRRLEKVCTLLVHSRAIGALEGVW